MKNVGVFPVQIIEMKMLKN